MDTKITLSFDEQVIRQAKEFAASHNISLSRLTEFLFRQVTSGDYQRLEDLPIADWVNIVAEEQTEYTRSSSRKKLKSEFFDSKK